MACARQQGWAGVTDWWPALLLCLSCQLQAQPLLERDLTELSLEQLLDIDITLTARRGESLRESPAAVYVLNNEAIRRSGATSIPELLRLVPGVEVARFGTGKWGVGIRGFNGGIFTNRLLILVDGRSVFSPAKIGMFWDTLDTLIADIERIEVVRGPGAALWGSNAFNGVINIVTRHARDTRGGLIQTGGGDEEKWFAGLRYGTELEGGGYLRGYLKAFERDDASRPDGSENHDGWTGTRVGMRFDRGEESTGALSLQLNAYEGEEGEELDLPDISSPSLGGRFASTLEYSGINLQAHWRRQWSRQSNYSLKFYADHSERQDTLFDLTVDSYDLDFEHDYRFADRQRLIWGLAYRYTEDKLPEQYIRFVPERRHYEVASGFAQYEYSPSEEWRFIAGSKIEHNDFSGQETQPNVRAIWSPDKRSSLWLAVSRASRTPSRTEHDVIVDFDFINPLVQLQIQGSEDFDSEKLLSHELGWRGQFGKSLNVDVSLFYNEYDGLRTLEPTEPEPASNPPPFFIVPIVASNQSDARSWGGELVLTAILSPAWHTEFHYSHVQIDVDPLNSADPNVENAEGESPQHRATFKSFWELSSGFEISATVRYVDDVDGQNIDEYTELDLVLSKRLGADAVLSIVGQNLLDRAHEEYVDRVVGTPRAEVERGAYLKLTLGF